MKTVDSEILPDLQANKLIYDSLMNTDTRYKTPQSETKNGLSLTVITVVRVQHFPVLFPQTQIPQGNVKKTKWYLYIQWIAMDSKHVFLLLQRISSKLSRDKLCLASKDRSKLALCPKGWQYFFQGCLLYKKDIPEHSQCFCSQDMQQCETHGKLSLNLWETTSHILQARVKEGRPIALDHLVKTRKQLPWKRETKNYPQFLFIVFFLWLLHTSLRGHLCPGNYYVV